MKKINDLLRENIRLLKPYSSARDEFSGEAEVYLDANENAYGSVVGPYNRYPDPHQRKVKAMLARIKGVDARQIFLGNGSDEAIDLLIRAFCEPGQDQIILVPPTYGMYTVSASINNVETINVPLKANFQLDISELKKEFTTNSKLLFLCSPNNPTGNSLDPQEMIEIIKSFPGIVVVDEAYIDFSKQASLLSKLDEFNNLVVLQTFSKAWGMAGLRLGMAYAHEFIIEVFNKVKPPYNVNILTQEKALLALERVPEKDEFVEKILKERDRMEKLLQAISWVEKVYHSDANFLLVKVPDPKGKYEALLEKGIVVRDRSKVLLCEGCLRLTIGTEQENDRLIEALHILN